MIDIKVWIKENLQYSRGLICKKCKKEWFEKYRFLEYWDEVYKLTTYLDNTNPTFPQRVWHIVNDNPLVKCAHPDCHNIPTFWSFNLGYLDTCSPVCAQNNPTTRDKIKATNFKKYGVAYGIQNKEVQEKSKQTCLIKYGVENVSQCEEIADKKQETCLKNYGTNWMVERSEIAQKRINTSRGDFYDTLSTTKRLDNKCTPLFTKEEYIDSGIEQKYKCRCNVCSTEFSGWLHDGDLPRCTTCYKNSSVFEKEITEYVKSLLPLDNVIENDHSILSNNYELGIYIPSKKVAIECDGLYWHGEVGGKKDRKYHVSKTDECEAKGIRLIHILEDEWTSKQVIVKSKINHILGLNKSKIVYARKCKVVEVDKESKKVFLTNNHVQGNDAAQIKYGLEYDGKLVAIITFSPKRAFIGYKNKNDKNDGEYELCRYAALIDHNVLGGASKLMAHFIKMHKPIKILSYADRRWTQCDNNVYEKIGFKKISNGVPNYWYFGNDELYRRHHRFGFRKNVLSKRLAIFDDNLTEWQNMQNNGWDRIWDCGNLKYEMVIS